MTRRALTVLLAATLAAFVASVVAVAREFSRLLRFDPQEWRG